MIRQKFGKPIAGIFLTLISAFALAQEPEYKITPRSADGKELPLDFDLQNIEEKERIFVPESAPESEAKLGLIDLVSLDGKDMKPALDRVTIIEYWSMDANKNNLFWNRMRELEQKFAGSDEVQFISINYDIVLNGKHQRAAVKQYLENHSTPSFLLLDRLDGLRDVFQVAGPVSYMLIDHRRQYTNVGRGDDPETLKIFDQHLPNAMKYQQMARAGVALPKN